MKNWSREEGSSRSWPSVRWREARIRDQVQSCPAADEGPGNEVPGDGVITVIRRFLPSPHPLFP